MKITSFDKSTLKTLQAEIEKALRPIAEKYGVGMKMNGGSYGPGAATLKVQIVPLNTDGTRKSEFEDDFRKYAESYGLKPEHLFAEVTYGGKRYKIVGLNTNRYKMPLHVERDGKRFFVPMDAANALRSKKDGGSFLDDERMISSISAGLDKAPKMGEPGFGQSLVDRAAAEKKTDELLRDNPEMYFADGELKGTKKQIREHWIRHFMNPVDYAALGFGSAPVTPAPKR